MPPMKRLSGKTLEHDTSRLRVYLKGGGGTGLVATRQFIYELPGVFTSTDEGLRAYNRFGSDLTVQEVHCSVSTPVSGDSIWVDVYVYHDGAYDSVTDWNEVEIAVGDEVGVASGLSHPFLNGDYMTVVVDGAGANLAVCILVG